MTDRFLFEKLLLEMQKLNKNIKELVEQHKIDRGDYTNRFSPNISNEQWEPEPRRYSGSSISHPGADL